MQRIKKKKNKKLNEYATNEQDILLQYSFVSFHTCIRMDMLCM